LIPVAPKRFAVLKVVGWVLLVIMSEKMVFIGLSAIAG
jgi:hypothetical protein